jgi:hypothetical protein
MTSDAWVGSGTGKWFVLWFKLFFYFVNDGSLGISLKTHFTQSRTARQENRQEKTGSHVTYRGFILRTTAIASHQGRFPCPVLAYQTGHVGDGGTDRRQGSDSIGAGIQI